MAIVDFQQDPAAPYGTGNFRDESGRMMYLHDPDTASQFVKTMPGAPKKQVGDESTAIAQGRVDAPAGPDNRLARNDSGTAAAAGIADTNAAIGDLEAAVNNPHPPAAPAPPAAPPAAAPAPGAPGAAAAAGIADTNAAVAGLEQSVNAPPGAPAPASAAPAAAPPAPGAPPTGGGAALVQTLDSVTSGMQNRLQPDAMPGARSFDSAGLPLSAVEQGEQVQVKEGRDVARGAEEIAERNRVGEAGDQMIRDEYGRKGRQLEASFEGQRTMARDDFGRDVNTAFEKGASSRAAFEKVDNFKKALEKNDKSLDPDRYMRNMSTGKFLSMIILATLNGGFGAINKQTSNGVIDAMDDHIERDIQRQKDEITSGRVRIQNDIDLFQKQGFSDKEAETLARDRLMKNLAAFKDAEAKRVGAMPEMLGQANMLIQPRIEQRMNENAMTLRSLENEVNRSMRTGQTHGTLPGTVMMPSDKLAQETLEDRKIQRENAASVGEVVGHPVSIDEAKEIRNDSQDLGKRLATGASARKMLDQLRTELGLIKRNGKWTGDADPGSRPGGFSATDRSTLIDTYYANLKRADIMGMVREPSAVLQNEFAKITERPFFDSQIIQQLDAYERVVSLAEEESRRGFSDEALAYYDRKRQPVPPRRSGASGAKPAPARGQAPAAKPSPAAPEAEAPATPPVQTKAPGGLRFE